MAFFVQRQLDFIQTTGEVFFRNIAELEARQRSDGVAQRAQEQLALQLVAAGRRAVEISAANAKGDVGIRRDWRGLRRQVQGHAFRHKVFNVEIPFARLIVAGAGANVPHAGSRAAVERISKLVQAIHWFTHHRADHLAVRLNHLQFHRLLRQRLAVAIAQQRIKDHRFAGTIEIARAKHKELFAKAGRACDREFRQIQRRQLEVEERGLPLFARQQQRGFFIGLQGDVALAVAFRFRQGLPFGIEQLHLNTRLGGAVFQTLGKNVQPVMVAMRRDADIAEGKQRRRVAVAITARRVHDRHVDARLLERLDVAQRQQQLFASITRRVEIEAAAVDQIRHLQQFIRFPVA